MEDRQKGVFRLQLLSGLGVVPLIGAAFLCDPGSDPGIAGITAVALFTSLWSFFWGHRAFKRSDEFMREGSTYAWYWGGLFGVALSMPVYLFVMWGGLRWFGFPPGNRQTAIAFTLGYALAMLSIFSGTVVGGVIWFRSKA